MNFEWNHEQIEKVIDLYKQKLNCGIPKTTITARKKRCLAANFLFSSNDEKLL
jgi:hypothetical protein